LSESSLRWIADIGNGHIDAAIGDAEDHLVFGELEGFSFPS
jgi:hypothetical protein